MEHSSSDSSVKSIHDRDNDSETSCSATGELESGDEEAEDQLRLHPASRFKDSLSSEDGSSRDSSPGPSIRRRVPSSPTLGSLHSRNVRHAPPHSYPDRHHDDPPAQVPQRSWYEFDLAVILAFVSPIGNLLTGGDHVKNLVFIIFLVYYLHQIIEGTGPHILICSFFSLRPHSPVGAIPESTAAQTTTTPSSCAFRG